MPSKATYLTLALFIIFNAAFAQQVNFEQRSVDYFFNKLFKAKFPNVSKLRFSGHTEEELTGYRFYAFSHSCFIDGRNLTILMGKNAFNLRKQIKQINLDDIQTVIFKNRKVKSDMTLYVFQVNVVGALYYTSLEIHHQGLAVYYFYFELNEKGEILRDCETGVTI